MKPSNRLTPYPVLATYRYDYLDASFQTSIHAVQEFGDLHLDVSFSLDESAIEELIACGKAEYAVHVECPLTSLRFYKGTDSGLAAITLGRLGIKSYIEVCTFIVARTELEGFSSPHFHPDYEGFAFDVPEGGILAIGECRRIDVKNNEDIERHASIINVMQASAGQRDPISVNTDQSDNVLVALKPDLYRIYAEYGGGGDSDIVMALVILPALQIVLTRMIDTGEDGADSEKEWFRSMVELLAKNDISLSDLDNYNKDMDALSVAQRMLGQPLDRSLKSLVREA